MSIMNFNTPKKSLLSNFKAVKLILGIGSLAAVIGLGSTLAASINLNAGAAVEFGQGVAQTTACDSNVVVTPLSTFVNSEGGGDFLFTSFTVSDVSSECDGKIFTIKAYKDGQSDSLDLYTTSGVSDPYNQIQVLDTAGSFSLIDAGLLADDISDVTGGFRVNLSTTDVPVSTAVASAMDVDRITIESRDSTETAPVSYSVGDTGPGGGFIYYYNASGFNCGATFSTTGSPTGGLCHYLEVAPSGWNGGVDVVGKTWSAYDLQVDNVVGITDETSSNNTSETIGMGYRNSLAIVAQFDAYVVASNSNIPGTSFAAGAARAYTGGTKSDWYLPTLAEFNTLCQWNKGVAQSFTTDCPDDTVSANSATFGASTVALAHVAGFAYWTSSEYSDGNVWFQGMYYGTQGSGGKVNVDYYYVRPIRSF